MVKSVLNYIRLLGGTPMNELISFLQREFPVDSSDIQISLNTLYNTLEKVKLKIDTDLPNIKGNYTKIGEYYSMSRELEKIQKLIKEAKEAFNIQQKRSSNTSSKKAEKKAQNVSFSHNKDFSNSTLNKDESNTKINSNPNDYRFIKNPSSFQSDPKLDGLSQRIGTPSHIEFLHMEEEDTRRHKSRCLQYNKKTATCMCPSSPYYSLKCGGSSHCKHYEESRSEEVTSMPETHTLKKPLIGVLSKDKIGICPKCKRPTKNEYLIVNYFDKGECKQSTLSSYYCSSCKSSYILDTLYSRYVFNKDKRNIDVDFQKIN